MKSGGSLSIWFFIGVSLAVNGAVILGTGIYELVNPPEYRVVLYQLHANIWWGAALFLGLLFSLVFRPAPEREAGNLIAVRWKWKRIRMSEKKMTMGVIIGNRGFFPRPVGEVRGAKR